MGKENCCVIRRGELKIKKGCGCYAATLFLQWLGDQDSNLG